MISGAHLDSVPEGPGINDDGSGTATNSSLPRRWRLDLNLRNQVRFIWFSGEEQGLFGSTFNADGLTKAERGNVIAMLDFDMLASPNYALLIYDGDGWSSGSPAQTARATSRRSSRTSSTRAACTPSASIRRALRL